MPYKLSARGKKAIVEGDDQALANLTSLQVDAFAYLYAHPDTFVGSSTIASYYHLAPQAMRGPCASLHKQGLIDKKES